MRLVGGMDNEICYLNTDLDLVSTEDLSELGNVFENAGTSPLHLTKGEDGLWYTTLETDKQHTEPEANISEILTIIESLTEPDRQLWINCTRREFNIGYSCGDHPRAFIQGLSPELLRRVANVDASILITLYPIGLYPKQGLTAQDEVW